MEKRRLANERRRHERHELLAAVELCVGDAKVMLTVRNISLSGVMLIVNDPSEFPPGSEYELIVFDAFNPARTARAVGRVVRRTPDSIALAWDDHEDSMSEIAEFLMALKAIGGPQ